MTDERMTNEGIIKGNVYKQLLLLFFPILFGSFFQQLYNTVDAIIVGKFIGKEALSAVGGSTATIINLLVGFFIGLSSGATVIIAQYYGARKYRELRESVHTSIAIAILGGLILMIVGIGFAPMALKAMDTPPDIMDGSLIYIRIYFWGMIPNMVYNIGSGILRAIGDSKRPLYFLIVACVANIILDILLVVIFKFGIYGVAIATVLSQVISAVLVIFVLVFNDSSYKLTIKHVRINKNRFKEIFKIGLPAGIQSTMYSISNIIIQTSVNSFGTDTIAAWTAHSKLDSIFWMMMGAFDVAITTFVGQNYGAKKMERVRSGVRKCLALSFVGTIIMSLIFYFGGEYLFRFFTNDMVVVNKGMEILKLFVPSYLTFICIEILSGALRGMGDSLIPMIMTGLGVCLLRVLWVIFIVPIKPNITTVTLSYPISWSVTSILFIVYYRNYWRKYDEN